MDYRFLAVNPAFERITGLSAARIVGQTVRTILPKLEPVWISKFGQVVVTGESVRFEDYAAELGKWFKVYAFRTAPDQFAAVVHDEHISCSDAGGDAPERGAVPPGVVSDLGCGIFLQGE